MDKRFRKISKEETVHRTQSVKIDTEALKKIKVEITRRIPGNKETKELDHSLEKPEEIKIYRCEENQRRKYLLEIKVTSSSSVKCEGSRPIFDRNDVIVNREETEHRTVSAYSPSRQNNTHKFSDNYKSFGSSPRRTSESPERSSSRYSQSPKRKNKSSTSKQSSASPYRDPNKPGTSRDFVSSSRIPSRNRSRSRESSRRSKRSRSRSSRREFGRRRNSRSPYNRERRSYDRRYYGEIERDRRRDRSRSPRYARSSSRRRSRDRPCHNPHLPPIDPATVIPLIIPPFYGPEDAVWFPPPMRPPMFVPPGVHMPPRGMYRGPMPGMRFPMPGQPPYGPRQPPFRQVRPQIRPQ